MKKTNQNTNLNSRYTFNNLIVGSFNEFAHAMGLAVLENVGVKYSPLFIYGGVGLGKTHLIQAIGNKVGKDFKEKNVRYVSCEDFVNDMVGDLRNHNNTDNFKKGLSSIDVLIIDNIQCLAGKNVTQEAFINVLDHLCRQNKQVVIASGKSPDATPVLKEKIRSEFEHGMIVNISLPNYETKLVVLKAKLQEQKAGLPDYVLTHLAVEAKSIRDLERSLGRMLFSYRVNLSGSCGKVGCVHDWSNAFRD